MMMDSLPTRHEVWHGPAHLENYVKWPRPFAAAHVQFTRSTSAQNDLRFGIVEMRSLLSWHYDNEYLRAGSWFFRILVKFGS